MEISSHITQNMIEAYTDGSAFGNSRRNRNARAGVGVWFAAEHPLNVSENLLDNFDGPCTNSRAELAACIRAIEEWTQIPNRAPLLIYTDSTYVCNTVTKWAANWEARGWRKANGQPVENLDLVQMLTRLAQRYKVQFSHVRAHVGIHGNEMADALARAGAGVEESTTAHVGLVLDTNEPPQKESENNVFWF